MELNFDTTEHLTIDGAQVPADKGKKPASLYRQRLRIKQEQSNSLPNIQLTDLWNFVRKNLSFPM